MFDERLVCVWCAFGVRLVCVRAQDTFSDHAIIVPKVLLVCLPNVDLHLRACVRVGGVYDGLTACVSDDRNH